MHVFPLEIKRWRTLMQAKLPLACHANLAAQWGGAAAREGRLKRVGVWDGGGGGLDESIMCIEVQQWTTPNHIPTLILMRLNCMPWIIISLEFCLCASVPARNMNSRMSVCYCTCLRNSFPSPLALFRRWKKKNALLCQACKFNWINDMSPSLYCTWRFLVLFFPSLSSFSSYCRTGMRKLVFQCPTITWESLTPIPLSRALGYRTTLLGLWVNPSLSVQAFV